MGLLKKNSPAFLFPDSSISTFTQYPTCTAAIPSQICISHTYLPRLDFPIGQVMMFVLVGSEGKKMNPVFLDSGLRLDPELYIERVLVPHMLPLILKNNPYPEEYIFFQDKAPCNTSKKTQKWLEEQINFWSKEIWPLKSHDLKSVDFSLWTKVQVQACKQQQPSPRESQELGILGLVCTKPKLHHTHMSPILSLHRECYSS